MNEVQAITGLSLSGCYANVAAGIFPCVRMGRSVRVPFLGLQAWIRQNTNGGEVAR